jgi:hypothetical protein
MLRNLNKLKLNSIDQQLQSIFNRNTINIDISNRILFSIFCPLGSILRTKTRKLITERTLQLNDMANPESCGRLLELQTFLTFSFVILNFVTINDNDKITLFLAGKFYPEDKTAVPLRNIDTYLPDYITSHPRNHNLKF